MIEIEQKQKLPVGWRWTKLGDVCEVNPKRSPDLNAQPQQETTFVPMPAVDAKEGFINKPEVKCFEDVRKGYTYFEEEDVLFAKITPCMQNGKHAIARNLLNGFGFGTTEFHIIRPSKHILPEWIHGYVRQPHILYEAKQHFTGAVGQQRVPKGFLESLEIPLPPLPEQKRIAEILTKQMAAAARAKKACQEKLAAAEKLPASYLNDIFNSDKARAWVRLPFGEVAMLQRGHDLTEQDRIAGEYPVITSSGIVGTHYEYRAKGPGVVTGRSGSVGRVHYVENDFWPHNTALYVKDFFGNYPRYIYYLLQWVNVKAVSSGTGVPTLDRKEVHKIIVRHPTYKEQKRIADILTRQMAAAEKTKKAIKEELELINKLPASLLQQAFKEKL